MTTPKEIHRLIHQIDTSDPTVADVCRALHGILDCIREHESTGTAKHAELLTRLDEHTLWFRTNNRRLDMLENRELTVRDHFAIAALSSLTQLVGTKEDLAAEAYRIADAMMLERSMTANNLQMERKD